MVERMGLDIETWPIGPGAPFPRPVCLTWARLSSAVSGGVESGIHGNGDPDWAERVQDWLAWLEADPGLEENGGSGQVTREVVWHFGHGFDMPALIIHFPHLTTRIFAAMHRHQVRETSLREKLLNLALSGNVDYYFTPDGQAKDIRYRLADLAQTYLGKDRFAQKGEDAEGKKTRADAWRLNFYTLDGIPSVAYPVEAADYAKEDAIDALLVSQWQDVRARREFTEQGAIGHDGKPFDVFRTEPLHVGAMVCLSLATHEGFGVDPKEVAYFEEQVAKARRPEQTELLFTSGLRTRPTPLRPYANGALHGSAGECPCGAPTHDPGTPKMVAADGSHLVKGVLLDLVVKTWLMNRLCDEDGCSKKGMDCDQHGLPPLKRTEPSKTFPEGQISCDGEVIGDLAAFANDQPGNPANVLAQHEQWSICEKLDTTEIPRLKEAIKHGCVIHGGFDDFKKTSRTSSRKSNFYPSINIQQIARGFEIPEMGPDCKPILDAKGKPKVIKVEPRHAYVPRREGWVLVSIDYSFIELVTLAQTTKRVIGYSVLLDKINKGFDPHAYLGSRLAIGLDADFADYCRHVGASSEDDVYRAFVSMKAGTDDEKKFYKTWRTFAKPTGLGFPGGLGAKTFISYAKNLYGITIKSIEQAKSFKQVWINAFPENGEYLNRYVRDHLRDERHSTPEREKFAYFSPLGAYRARCSFTEVANGMALQTPSAEGLKLALWKLQRSCWDPSEGSMLYGCRVLAAIHDEALITMPVDQFLHERAMEASKIWIGGMKIICPDAMVQAEPAIMFRWDKNAEPVYGPDERLRVWLPTEKYGTDSRGRLRSAS